ncbi:MAG: HD-GYP domain-containing protein [Phycisphaeraceae bacterium]|nr:HD-GYP domain-containing protein [Phycisphaeraceae bacterium]MBX3407245.1 HD-GYP domain-containing protein [Phycisphaeraceae bacterium]
MSTQPTTPASPIAIRDAHAPSIHALRERCMGLGLATWRCDNLGAILAEPLDTGPVGLLLGSSTITKLVRDAARKWGEGSRDRAPGVEELFPGCWAIPLTEQRRRERVGFIVALAFGERALGEEFFLAACRAAHLDAQATRRSLLPRARYDAASAAALRDALLWMGGDLNRIEEHTKTVSGFTRQLTDCFETIDLLYTLGRSMNDLTQPSQFIHRMCERLRSTLPFTWIAATFNHRADVSGPVAGRFFASGDVDLDSDALALASSNVPEDHDPHVPLILTEIGGKPIPGSGQVLVQPIWRGSQQAGALLAGDKHGDDPQVSSYDIQLLEAASGYVGAYLDNAVLYADQQALFLGTLEALTASIDAKDRYTCGHSRRVAHLSHRLALAIGMSDEDADRVRIAGLVHDVGKIGVPEAVLTKTGRLTDEEFEAIKQHPEIGHRILKDIPLLADVLPGVLHHHERFDGKGYPHGLAGDSIPVMARIIALADTFDAMSSSRSYRAAMPRAQVLAEVARCAGVQFDADLARRFVELDFSEYDHMVLEDVSAGVRRAAA